MQTVMVRLHLISHKALLKQQMQCVNKSVHLQTETGECFSAETHAASGEYEFLFLRFTLISDAHFSLSVCALGPNRPPANPATS